MALHTYDKEIRWKKMLIDIALYYVGGRGGVETVTTKISEGLRKKGNRVRVMMAYALPM